jgi:ribosomal-protein-alanine N-acetyltransferase
MVSDPVRLVPLDEPVLRALALGDLALAGRAAGVALPQAYLEDGPLWLLRLGQATTDPENAGWLVFAVVRQPGDTVVGHAGFHGAPDEAGTVEVGYWIIEQHRRRGHARAALAQLLAYAADHGARTARASVGPHNAASLALVRSFGFAQVGDQWDAEDGLELVFERALVRPRSAPRVR